MEKLDGPALNGATPAFTSLGICDHHGPKNVIGLVKAQKSQTFPQME